ncbi:MAG: hypothetical protein A3J46_00470 [Candidatus Yanofskybacteria bacterium RIFCSPHIGHO2_02_FULL_41_11]|uniref:Uncharacterized protein n=1 Tax=Candidatus Yanofskybacteria bacterium RIFCSPHIGHO2_02_FULL_41_11 TaxID=1802675 RepID=A0A1F8F8M6_9BACT|nr:MAG: hypothetical protein A3J46_00470 [Candidatus Yanofskybacteria bacterium RIFCSPHIGHO2_02_FULL_41_11]
MFLFFLSILIIFLDFVFIPSLTGFLYGSLSSLFLISLILYFGIRKNVVVACLFFCILVELSLGYKFGSYSASFLFICLLILLISRFINIPTVKGSGNILTISILSLAAPFLNYVFFVVFNYIDERNLLGLRYEIIDLAYLGYYALEAFLILNAIKLLDAQKRI